jgi:dimethylargininase
LLAWGPGRFFARPRHRSDVPIAIVRDVPDSIVRCELTHLAREPIDVERARREHAAYTAALRDLGLVIHQVPPAPELPDSVFVEDTAVVFDELAVIMRPGAASRRAELDTVRDALKSWRVIHDIAAPATIDGGDVLVLDRDVIVGLTTRTTLGGVSQLAGLIAPHGYRVRPVAITGCLHLKSAVTRVGPDHLLVNPAWIDAGAQFPGWRVIECDPGEPHAANALLVGDAVVFSTEYPRTGRRLERAGCRIRPVPAAELARAEGGVTCCSLIVR